MHEYYRKNKGKLQKEMDGYLKLVRSEIEEVFGKSYPQAFAEIWSCYEREMLEHFPFIGGDGSSGTRNLTGCMFFVAVGVVGKKYGLSTHDWGRLATTLYERHFDQMPRFLRRLAGGLFHHCPGLVTYTRRWYQSARHQHRCAEGLLARIRKCPPECAHSRPDSWHSGEPPA